MANKVGRPTKYTKQLGLMICAELARGKSMKSICALPEYPSQETVYNWLFDGDETKKEFVENYARARAVQAELMFEEIIEISDKSDQVIKSGAEKKSSAYAQNQRLKVDTRKWYLSKVLPKKFGDKVDITSDGSAIKGNTIILKDFDGTKTDSK